MQGVKARPDIKVMGHVGEFPVLKATLEADYSVIFLRKVPCFASLNECNNK
jgi:hypothetical protein